MDSYYVKTKDEIKKTLDELKEDVANGTWIRITMEQTMMGIMSMISMKILRHGNRNTKLLRKRKP